jgi:hypothetical protein
VGKYSFLWLSTHPLEWISLGEKEKANVKGRVEESQLREKIQEWLSPPDPSTNYYMINSARKDHREKTASWFFQGRIFEEWKSTPSLLWIHRETHTLLASNN